MKNKRSYSVIILLTGVLAQIYYFFPWIQGKEHAYTGITYWIAVFLNGSATDVLSREFPSSLEMGGNQIALVVQFSIVIFLMVVAQICSAIATVGGLKGFRFKICSVIPCAISGIMMYLVSNPVDNEISSWQVLGNLSFFYPYFIAAVSVFQLVVLRLLEAWEESSIQVKLERERKRAYKIERKRRLHFPGRYSRLFYRVLWKDLKYRWRDMAFLFLALFLSALFLFLGLGIYQNVSGSYGEDGGMLGLGLVEIIRDFLIAVALIGLFMISVALSYYQKRKHTSTGLIQTLGIRSQALSAVGMGELMGCFMAAVLSAYAAGSLLIFLICLGIRSWMTGYEVAGTAGPAVYIWTLAGMTLIALCAYVISLEMQGRGSSIDTRGASVRWEPVTSRFTIGVTVLAVLLGVVCVWFYQQRRMAESLLLVCGLLLCVTLAFRGIWGLWLVRKQKDPEQFFPMLPAIFQVRWRFRTTTRYLSLLMVIHVLALAVFAGKCAGSLSASPVQELYLYDYIFLANSQDDAYLEELTETCKATVLEFPMVRTTTLDNTEWPENIQEIVIQQGQNIGISESTYQELKKLAGQEPEELSLDAEGRKIHVVYQQDQASKAKPLDWYQFTSKPYVHIGQALLAHDMYTREETYPPREIVSEERESLIGAYRQGKYENLIVFSDEYFESVQDSWKTTNLLTGETVSEEEAVPEVTIHEWPTRLWLVQVPEDGRDQAEEILARFREAHAFDESFDPLVKSAYDSSEALHQRTMERQMEILVNGIVVLMLLAVSIFLLRMKIKMDLPELKKNDEYLETFGMEERQRIRLMNRAVSRYMWIPLSLAGVVTALLTGILWKLRLYQSSDILSFLKYAIPLWGGYVFIQIINAKRVQKGVRPHPRKPRKLVGGQTPSTK